MSSLTLKAVKIDPYDVKISHMTSWIENSSSLTTKAPHCPKSSHWLEKVTFVLRKPSIEPKVLNCLQKALNLFQKLSQRNPLFMRRRPSLVKLLPTSQHPCKTQTKKASYRLLMRHLLMIIIQSKVVIFFISKTPRPMAYLTEKPANINSIIYSLTKIDKRDANTGSSTKTNMMVMLIYLWMFWVF